MRRNWLEIPVKCRTIEEWGWRVVGGAIVGTRILYMAQKGRKHRFVEQGGNLPGTSLPYSPPPSIPRGHRDQCTVKLDIV